MHTAPAWALPQVIGSNILQGCLKCEEIAWVLFMWHKSITRMLAISKDRFQNKLTKLGDARAISKYETITDWLTDPLTDRGRCSEMLLHLKTKTCKASGRKRLLQWGHSCDSEDNSTGSHLVLTIESVLLQQWTHQTHKYEIIDAHLFNVNHLYCHHGGNCFAFPDVWWARWTVHFWDIKKLAGWGKNINLDIQ